MPMHRWMQSAAGGTNQRLKPGLAMIRSRSRRPAGLPTRSPAPSTVVMSIALRFGSPFFGVWCGNASALGSSVLQLRDRLAHERLESGAAGLEVREDGEPHARIPEFLQMIGDAGGGLRVALAREEFADLV